MPELSRLRRLSAAVFNVYYHTQWRERGLLDPASFPGELSLLGLEESIQRIAEDFVVDPPYGRAAARLALGQLARAAASSRHGRDEYARHMLPVIRALLGDDESASAAWRKLGAQPRDSAEEFLHAHLLERKTHHPNEHFVHVLNLFDDVGHGMRRFCKSWSYADRITDICVSVEVRRPYADFPGLLDPRNWSANVPLVWEASDALASLPENTQGPFVAKQPKGGPFEGKFYEVALFSVGLVNFATYRNLLNIAIDQPGPECDAAMPPQLPTDKRRTHFCYTQYECLETEMLGLGTFDGGIDVDHGFGLCEEIDENWCRIAARKRARFDKPDGPLNLLYNGVASIYLPMLIEALVLFAAII
ncbi:MAG TPA: hypothetical protein VJR89_14820 [Polyangiales bacterium]|nr:hypothetical protein [Polyangiales bacterium]